MANHEQRLIFLLTMVIRLPGGFDATFTNEDRLRKRDGPGSQ